MKRTVCVVFMIHCVLLFAGCTGQEEARPYLEAYLSALVGKDFDAMVRHNVLLQGALENNKENAASYRNHFESHGGSVMTIVSTELADGPAIDEKSGALSVGYKVVLDVDGRKSTRTISLVKVDEKIREAYPFLSAEAGEWTVTSDLQSQ